MLKNALKHAIQLRGPLSVSSYMRQCLTDPNDGYYIKQDPLGAKGDFITSPEISQMFGELVGINIITQWFAHGQPKKMRLVELGPGRGTLLADMLRAARSFPSFYDAIESVQLVEASVALKERQKEAVRDHSQSKKFEWLDLTSEIPNDGMHTFVVAHEFFDALPIHQFQRTSKGWQEQLVDYDTNTDKFVSVLGPTHAFLSAVLRNQPRYAKLPEGSSIEICPEAWDVASKLSQMLKHNKGGALIFDYGPSATIPVNTFRAFRHHTQVSPFDVEPGTADLTADVDFKAIADIAANKYHISTHGPVTQANWLHRMGIGARATMLANAQSTPEGKQRIASAYHRLTDPLNMGKTYKVLSLSSLPPSTKIEGFYEPHPDTTQ